MKSKHINLALFVPQLGCPRQCVFCNQRQITGKVRMLEPEDIDKAVKASALASPDEGEVREIAFFGGSFTAIDREYMVSLLEAASKYVNSGLFTGIRISTRPDAVDAEVCKILKKYSVSSVELGAQSMDDGVLSLNKRGHRACDVEKAVGILKDFSFEIGLQMMTGLYGSDCEESLFTARKLIDLKPKTVRIYPTLVLKGTELEDLYSRGLYKPQSLEDAVNLCSKLLLLFYEADIDVIRLGLHSGGLPDGYVAGPYHPAFRELCESKVYLQVARQAFKDLKAEPGSFCLRVNPRFISQMVGQGRSNLTSLKSEGYE
ncbi:MAG TPA: radical SAM protein, partial [Clostridiales bacterium]|nr:radical SAM protein [Clostridiales bacterium]